ncbi:MAG: hypothetical protein AMJ53_10420 [Gammaproteobacteria bacterium SG8_11]|nr:MAG: hypothetical protein AMJ53_10420 [Gammaproteobacteria bacterium SG8_11]
MRLFAKMNFMHLIMPLLLISSVLISGCSTIKMHSDENIKPGPYVGTKQAIKDTQRHWENYDYYGQVFVYAVDVPLCLIADTIVLPYAIYNTSYP